MALQNLKEILLKLATDGEFRSKFLDPQYRPIPLEDLAKTDAKQVDFITGKWLSSVLPNSHLIGEVRRYLYGLDSEEKIGNEVIYIQSDVEYSASDIRF